MLKLDPVAWVEAFILLSAEYPIIGASLSTLLPIAAIGLAVRWIWVPLRRK